MPIEIKELHIKVAVAPPKSDQPAASTEEAKPSPCDEKNDRQQLVSDCVEQVMQILKEKSER